MSFKKRYLTEATTSLSTPKPPEGSPIKNPLGTEQQITQDLNQEPKTLEPEPAPQPNEKPDVGYITFNKATNSNQGPGDGIPANHKPTDNDLAKEQHRMNTTFQERVLKNSRL